MTKMQIDKELLKSLMGNWFYNIKEGKINKEILLFIGLDEDIVHSLKYSFYRISHNHKRDKFYTIFSFENLPIVEYNYDQNIILYTNKRLDWQKLKNTNRIMRCIDLNKMDKFIDVSSQIDTIVQNCDNYTEIRHFTSDYDHLFYLEKRNPIEIITNNIQAIKKFLSILLPDSHYFFTNCQYVFFRGYDFDLEKDLEYLDKKNILTSRLAIIIYKLSTLTDVSDKAIGQFYADELGITSTKKTNKIYEINSKCYDLNKNFRKVK